MMTLAQMRAALAAHGMTLRHDHGAGEYRVNFRHGYEASAYYTNDRQDALDTALDMARRRAALLAVAA